MELFALCVSLLVTFVSPANTVESIEVRFGGLTHMAEGTMYQMGV